MHALIAVAIVGLALVSFQERAPDGQAPTVAAIDAAIKVHVMKDGLAQSDNWYQDEYRHVDGSGVSIATRPGKDGGIYIEIASTEARKTSGSSVTIYLSRDGANHTIAGALGTWWKDFGARGTPFNGHLTDFRGDIYLARELGDSTAIRVQFALTAKKQETPLLLMGGVTVVPAK